MLRAANPGALVALGLGVAVIVAAVGVLAWPQLVEPVVALLRTLPGRLY